MTPGGAAVCVGEVWHRRATPVVHEFSYPVQYVWVDPADPAALTRSNRLWSHQLPAPMWFRARDYGPPGDRPLAVCVREEAAAVVTDEPDGPIRMLTQLRRWGWLFNPITVYVVWSDADHDPVAIVLEVTNTPWKERHRYAAPLRPGAGGELLARFPKQLHVSPFLDESFDYVVRLGGHESKIVLSIDVVDANDVVHLATTIDVTCEQATSAVLRRALWSTPLSTHRVSLAIHRQAWRLWRRGVDVVAHPRKRTARV